VDTAVGYHPGRKHIAEFLKFLCRTVCSAMVMNQEPRCLFHKLELQPRMVGVPVTDRVTGR